MDAMWRHWADSDEPRAFLEAMRLNEQLPSVLAGLVDTPQEKDFHPEGDAWTHTLCVVEAMDRICFEQIIYGDRREVLMFAALLHDIGKAVTTVMDPTSGRWTSPMHAIVGAELTGPFLAQIDFPTELCPHVVKLVRHHMVHTKHHTWFSEKRAKTVVDNLAPASLADLMLVMEADVAGRPPLPPGLPDYVRKLPALAAGV